MSALMLLGGISAAPTYGASVEAVQIAGESGSTAVVDGMLYARAGATLELRVTTTSDTTCVDVSGAFELRRTASAGRDSWIISSPPLGTGDGIQTITVAASPGVNPQGKCTGTTRTMTASFVLDNTGPVVTGGLTPAPNAAGWNKTNATVTWTATDSGVGVAAAQPFQTDSITSDGSVTQIALAQRDRLGNAGAPGSLNVRVDKTAPEITATQASAGYGQPTTVTFTCTDATSGVSSCLAEGSTTNAKTISGNGSVTGTVTDLAGNTKTLSVDVRNVDTTAPVLSGSPVAAPVGGWYRDDVTVHWTASDPESGIPTPPADTTIVGEGEGLTSTTSVANGAGLTTTATSNPSVNIDRTPPTTSVAGAPTGWTNDGVTLELAGEDNLSGVDITTYSIDGGSEQQGSSVTLSTEGAHTVRFFSTDRAGNVEAARTIDVRIDKTAPTISHRFTTPDAYVGGWTNQNVTVTFDCDDQGGSGLASCTDPVVVDSEGVAQPVTGSATDNAGNSSSHTTFVHIDKTAPLIEGKADRGPNTEGWYDNDVTVTFTGSDALSGIQSMTGSQVLGEGRNQSATGTGTDRAGNSAQMTVDGINVDKTAPKLTANAPTGWQRDDVTVTWDCTDALSGVQSAPADTLVEGEGANLSASANCNDKAGNVTTEMVTGIQIDRTAPTTLAEVPAAPASGWYGAPVDVTFNFRDNLSGVARTFYRVDNGADQTYDGPFSFGVEGTHTIEFWSEDAAGNIEAIAAPITLRIDRTAPTTTLINPISPATGWHVVSGIPFAFNAYDGEDRSGIAATYYTIDGEEHTYGEPLTENLSTGVHKVSYWSVDQAGNAETPREFEVQVDTVAPTISGTATPAANEFGWNNTDVAVTFTCDDANSGLQTGEAGCDGDTTLTDDGANQSVRGDAVDVAGNTSSTEVTGINIDKTKPTITGVLPDANAAGWYSDDVTVRWIGSDALAGINADTQPADTTITDEGRGLTAGPVTIEDKAGNRSEPATVSGINIDRTAPTEVTINGGPLAGGKYFPNNVPQPTCSAVDELSGLAENGCVVSGFSTAVGTHTLTATATDKAGNETTVTGPSYTVRKLTLTGFYAPVDKGIFNTVKGGATVPLKFEVFDQGVEVAATSVVKSFTTKTVNCTSLTSEDAVEELAGQAGTSLRYDATGGQFIQNWQTPKKVGTCYEVRMTTIDDGSITATFKLK